MGYSYSLVLRFALFAALMAVSIAGCSHAVVSRYSFDKQILTEADDKFKEKDYAEALRKYDDIVKRFPRSASARSALFRIGYLNIYYDNPQADWSTALSTFRQFQKDYSDDPRIDEVNTWIRILVAMQSFATQYGESSVRIQKLKNKSIERSENVEQLLEEIQRCATEKDSLVLEKNALSQKIKELEATILKIEKVQ
jgi:outer membrane protein assembly factor BamD (BamD/ComL family)